MALILSGFIAAGKYYSQDHWGPRKETNEQVQRAICASREVDD
jgi:hypothetical protein